MQNMLFFDLVIAFWIAVVPLYVFRLWWKRKTVPVSGARQWFAAICVIAWLVIVYGSFIEPRMLVVETYPVDIGEHDGNLRVAVIGDTHFGSFRGRGWADRLVAAVNAASPDVVVIAGDIVMNEAGMHALPAFAGLRSRYGTYAVLGNTDYRVGAVDVRKEIERYRIEVLTNESVPMDVDGTTVRLIGLDDVWFGSPDWESALEGISEDDVTILATHNPDAAPVAEYYGIDLVIAGHTHGGQVRLPLVGALAPLPTTIGQRYDQGLFWFGPTRLFITSGAGESGTRARLLNPPEISVLEVGL